MRSRTPNQPTMTPGATSTMQDRTVMGSDGGVPGPRMAETATAQTSASRRTPAVRGPRA
ncbi:MAG: hypothetical protein AVDCRST_MAG33-2641 [uncultured Thermomicrobiales bacterium]|uniref:Uncharacterized protein n=1 Tax=uncultured Thermomicrobiales bacterium TaxID=1645740 RepID=A0A6J4V9H5_9BACT|nr:MAG: hypothetical protein AVDCRST_MAG33-2641 [uncultured Thermomicrobiales bacterium]